QKAMPVIGYLGGSSPDPSAANLAAFRQGLNETGYVEGQNVAIEYRWAEGRYDRLPALAADLVGHKVDVIVASGGPSPTRAVKLRRFVADGTAQNRSAGSFARPAIRPCRIAPRTPTADSSRRSGQACRSRTSDRRAHWYVSRFTTKFRH